MNTRKLKANKEILSWGYSFSICILAWIILSYFTKSVPDPVLVFESLRQNNWLLLEHFSSTAISAFFGFILGLVFAISACFLAIIWRKSFQFFNIFALLIYSIPLIAAAPLATLIFGANYTGIVLGCIGSFLPIFLTGIKYGKNISKGLDDLVIGFGSSKLQFIKFISLPLMKRGWIVGAQSGWIWASLGALLGDFTGRQSGLGIFLVGSLVQGNLINIIVIMLLCITLSLLGLLVIRLISSSIVLNSLNDPIDISIPEIKKNDDANKNIALINLVNLVIIITIWQLISFLLNKDGGIFAGPIDLYYLFQQMLNGESNIKFSFLLSALGETWLIAFIGALFSLTFSFIIATGQQLYPFVFRPLIPIILLTQVTPIVTFIPLIAFYLGRDFFSISLIVILSTIYPAYIVFLRAFEDVSQNAIDVVRGFGANNLFVFRNVRLPYAKRVTIIALRLTIGRALLGAITGEYLLTGTGLGGILGQSRSQLDFRIVWFICLLVGITTLLSDFILLNIKSYSSNINIYLKQSFRFGHRIVSRT